MVKTYQRKEGQLQEKSNVAMKNDKILELEGVISQHSSEMVSLNARKNITPDIMPLGAMTYAIACKLCKTKDSALCEKCLCEIKSGFEKDDVSVNTIKYIIVFINIFPFPTPCV